MASPVKKLVSPSGVLPPGWSRMSRVTPCTMNMLASVTTMAGRRITAMKRALKAPARAPIASAAADQPICEAPVSCMCVASTTLTSEITAPAERSKPPVRITMVSPIAASTIVAPPADMKLKSK